jgi:hypothetical protein
MLRTMTTVNADGIALVSPLEDGPIGEPSVTLLEALHVRPTIMLASNCSACLGHAPAQTAKYVQGFEAGATAAISCERLRRLAIARCCPVQVRIFLQVLGP